MVAAVDYNTFAVESKELFPAKRLFFFLLEHSAFFNFLEFFKLTEILRKKLRHFSSILATKTLVVKGLLEMVSQQEDSIKGRDLTKQIQVINKEIAQLSTIKRQLENLHSYKGHRVFGDLNKLNKFLEDSLQAHYDLLRLYKRNNKKTNGQVSEYGRQMTEKSQRTLSKIINAN